VLREVAGDCATYFDPNSPAAIARALEHSPTPERAASRRARAALFGDGGTMAARYLAVFNEVLSVRNAA
jgi:hypothetical protein